MAARDTSRFTQRPKSKTPAQRSVELHAVQVKLKAEAAERRKAAAAPAATKPRRRPVAKGR